MKNKHAEYSFEEFFLYFNRLNKFTSSCELHPIKGFFPASILQKMLAAIYIWLHKRRVKEVFFTVWLVFLPLYVYQHIGWLIEERVD